MKRKNKVKLGQRISAFLLAILLVASTIGSDRISIVAADVETEQPAEQEAPAPEPAPASEEPSSAPPQ